VNLKALWKLDFSEARLKILLLLLLFCGFNIPLGGCLYIFLWSIPISLSQLLCYAPAMALRSGFFNADFLHGVFSMWVSTGCFSNVGFSTSCFFQCGGFSAGCVFFVIWVFLQVVFFAMWVFLHGVFILQCGLFYRVMFAM
jgi:hypothetical protein